LRSFNRCPERSTAGSHAVLIIAGHVDVQPDQRDDYLAAFADLVRRARRAPGCLDVAVTADVLDPGRVYVYERWESWPHLSAWREVASAPDVDIEVTDADIAMWDAKGQRSPFDQAPPEPDAR
jgi:quinol monooxygenase YgiN